MRAGALLALVVMSSLHGTCRLALASPLHEIELYNEAPKSSPTVELMIPLLLGAADSSERNNRARHDDDGPFSNIPDSAFTLDEGIRVNVDPAPLPTPSPTPAYKGDKAGNDKFDYYRPRSIYLGSSEQQTEQPPDIWRACQGLARERTGPAYDVLLLLCAELLDVAGPNTQRAQLLPLASEVAESSTPCTCCSETQLLDQRARRDFMPMGEDADKVLRYIRGPHRRRPPIMPPPPWAGDIQD
ncbi:unnamed protein product [Spodoptera littoralis]|uniref:Secreted protein n=1 Tax=Spodoptera littoralis TaxID=7109 RepID=A0A9P0I915_SPOLI|nr:unnamed protein product [Spodoptera littoralis]CAH1642401.1 unnamed protein product [Spodoptera littoralis]